MKKYTRKDINVKAQLHGKQFVTVEDAVAALMQLAEAAIKAGADENKMKEVMADDQENKGMAG